MLYEVEREDEGNNKPCDRHKFVVAPLAASNYLQPGSGLIAERLYQPNNIFVLESERAFGDFRPAPLSRAGNPKCSRHGVHNRDKRRATARPRARACTQIQLGIETVSSSLARHDEARVNKKKIRFSGGQMSVHLIESRH